MDYRSGYCTPADTYLHYINVSHTRVLHGHSIDDDHYPPNYFPHHSQIRLQPHLVWSINGTERGDRRCDAALWNESFRTQGNVEGYHFKADLRRGQLVYFTNGSYYGDLHRFPASGALVTKYDVEISRGKFKVTRE